MIQLFRGIQGLETDPLWLPTNVGRYAPTSSLNEKLWINLDEVYARISTDPVYPGSVNSVGLTMPTGFSVANSPVTETGVLAVTNTFTAGSVVFAMGTGFAEDNANFFWNNTDNRLGILTAAPIATFSVANKFYVDAVGNATFVDDTQIITMTDIRIHGYGTSNFWVGNGAGNFTLTGTNNIGLGTNAGAALTSATGSVFVGRQAGQNITSGVDNTLIGRQAGDDLVDGARNIIIGSGTDVVPFASNTSDSINIGNTIIGDRVSKAIKIGDVAQPDASAQLDVLSTTRGFLPPRMTIVQRNAISSPATGLMIYCIDETAVDASTGVLQIYNGTTWKKCW